MYTPRKFTQSNVDDLLAMIHQNPFATLVSHGKAGLDATHLPVLLGSKDDSLTLKAHIAKANPLWKNIQNGDSVLVVFNGPNAYVSPNHYPTKAEHGKAVPTWNYVVVHVKGAVKFHHDRNWLYQVVDELTTLHEKQSTTPWSIDDAPESFINNMLPAIVGIEVEVNSIEGQWKLSQNQPAINQQGVVEGLNAINNTSCQLVAQMVSDCANPLSE